MKEVNKYEVGDIAGDYTCIEVIKPEKGSKRYLMKCNVCGRTKLMLGSTIAYKKGITHKSCGEVGLKTKCKKFHRLWCAMRTRTTNQKYEHWEDYGGRGINSDEFELFIDFYDKMYESYQNACELYGEENVSLDRIDVNGNYCKDNCRWVHIDSQKGNCRKTIEFELENENGEMIAVKNVSGFAKEHGLNVSCLYDLVNGRLKVYKGLKARRIAN